LALAVQSAARKKKPMKCAIALLLTLLTSSAATYDTSEFIRNWLAEAGQTNLATITCTTNEHSGTINCRVQCANRNDLGAVWEALRSLPNKIRISQGSNYVAVVFRTPQDVQQWQGQQAVNRASAPQREAERQETAQQNNQEAIRERERQRDLEAINQLRASIQSAQQKNPDRGQIGLPQARIDGQQHQLAQLIAAYKGKYGREP
jgi:hypothetical protein